MSVSVLSHLPVGFFFFFSDFLAGADCISHPKTNMGEGESPNICLIYFYHHLP